MVSRDVIIRNEMGLHAMPASIFVKTASKFKSNITLKNGDMEVNGKSILNVMMLGATYNSNITIIAEGEDEEEAVNTLAELVENKFGVE